MNSNNRELGDTPWYLQRCGTCGRMNTHHTWEDMDRCERRSAQLDTPKPLTMDDTRTATATKVWKVECPCGTNWVYDEFGDSLPDECENCGRLVEIMPSELAMDQYDRRDLAVWLGG